MTEEYNSAKMGVLFLDDEPSILKSLERLVMDEEYEVFTATSGEKGLEILHTHNNIGLIVSDQRMPTMTGAEFLEKAKNITPSAMRVMLTGYADINAAIDIINKGGAHKYVTKPWVDEDLLALIKDLESTYKLMLENMRLENIIKQQNVELEMANSQLEVLVQEQTAKLVEANAGLKQANKRLKDSLFAAITSFAGLIEQRNQKVKSHSKTVSRFAKKIGSEIGLTGEKMVSLKIAALLHDIGKICMPDSLLNKNPLEMSSNEFMEYMAHPVRGQTTIDCIDGLKEAGIIIRHHHETFDGKGFPDGLSGKEIPIGSRIIAMADYIDNALRNHDESNAAELILRELTQECDRKFDPQLFKSVEKLIRDEIFSILR